VPFSIQKEHKKVVKQVYYIYKIELWKNGQCQQFRASARCIDIINNRRIDTGDGIVKPLYKKVSSVLT
jgi:hypothetical protein